MQDSNLPLERNDEFQPPSGMPQKVKGRDQVLTTPKIPARNIPVAFDI